MYVTDEANILRHYPLGDTGIILVADTAMHGIVHAVAKGARNPKSAFRGKIDLFYHVNLTWKPSHKSSLSTLSEIKLLNPRPGIRLSYERTLAGSYFSKLYEKGIEPGSPVPEFHDLLQRALDYLDTHEPDIKAVRHFERELTRLHGIDSPQKTADESLKQFLGALPRQRESLLKYLQTD